MVEITIQNTVRRIKTRNDPNVSTTLCRQMCPPPPPPPFYISVMFCCYMLCRPQGGLRSALTSSSPAPDWSRARSHFLSRERNARVAPLGSAYYSRGLSIQGNHRRSRRDVCCTRKHLENDCFSAGAWRRRRSLCDACRCIMWERSECGVCWATALVNWSQNDPFRTKSLWSMS